jgi:hypothetical protein
MVVMCIGGRDIKKRKGPVKEAKAKKQKPAKKVKDPNAPKRPPTAFFIFLWVEMVVVTCVAFVWLVVLSMIGEMTAWRD